MLDAVLEWVSQMTASQKVLATLVIFVAVMGVGITLTALALSWGAALALWLGAFACLVAASLTLPVNLRNLGPAPAPETEYDGAVSRLEAESQRESAPLNPLCRSQLLGHGARSAKAVVLLHGVSSCPRAFVDFAQTLYDRGYNVLALRMPYNGYADRSTDALRKLTAEALRAYGDTAVDIAAGLGDSVVVLGISAGGTVAAWTAQNRPEVERAVIVAPFFGLPGLGNVANIAAMRAMLLLPDISLWKDPIRRGQWEGMPHAYARQSTRGLAEIMRLGYAVFRQISGEVPSGGSAIFVTNDADRSVSNSMTDLLAQNWEKWSAPVARRVFEASAGLGHEIIDPMEPGSDPEITYPVLLRMIEAPVPDLLAEQSALLGAGLEN